MKEIIVLKGNCIHNEKKTYQPLKFNTEVSCFQAGFYYVHNYREGKLFCIPTNVTAKQLGNGRIMSFEAGIIKTSDILITTSGAVEFMLGIASSCKNPEAAMDFINLIYTDSDVANLINYGIEGIDYVKVEGTENVITTTPTSYLMPSNRLCYRFQKI